MLGARREALSALLSDRSSVTCIRCSDRETPADRPYCVHCTFVVRAEIEDGLRRIGDYLAKYAAFADWEDGAAPGTSG
jgi:hypothetical protein